MLSPEDAEYLQKIPGSYVGENNLKVTTLMPRWDDGRLVVPFDVIHWTGVLVVDPGPASKTDKTRVFEFEWRWTSRWMLESPGRPDYTASGRGTIKFGDTVVSGCFY
jgi:hypothetical protein